MGWLAAPSEALAHSLGSLVRGAHKAISEEVEVPQAKNRSEAPAMRNRSPATKDAEGWIHTGDLGFADEDGYFYVVDRLKELIKYKGYQVAPAELEALLLTHPAIADVAVVRSPDDYAGEVPKAFVVRKATVDEIEIMDFVAQRVSPHKQIRLVEFIEAIPKSPSGKILRRVLVERELATAAAPN